MSLSMGKVFWGITFLVPTQTFCFPLPFVSTCPGLLSHGFLCIQLGCSFPVLLLKEITLPQRMTFWLLC